MMRIFSLIVFTAIVFFQPVLSASNDTTSVTIQSYLVAGPLPAPFPALNEGERNIVKIADILAYDYFPPRKMIPADGEWIGFSEDSRLTWTEKEADAGKLTFRVNGENPSVYYASVYIKTDKWTKADVIIESPHLFEVYLNGERVGAQTQSVSGDAGDTNPSARFKQTLKLRYGSHNLILKTINDPENDSEWYIKTELTASPPFSAGNIKATTSPERFIDIKNVLDDPRVFNVSLTRDGKLAAVSVTTPVGTSPEKESWMHIFDTRDGSLYRTFRGGLNVENFAWAPDGLRFSYVQRKDGKSTLWIADLENGDKTVLLESIERFGSYEWSPAGDYIIFSAGIEDETEKDFMRQITKPVERWPWWTSRSYLHLVKVPSGVRTRLTAGYLSTNLNSISPDGSKIIISRQSHDFTLRPYTFTEFYILDLNTMSLDSLTRGPWTAEALWSPDGKRILILAGPSFFGESGIAVSDTVIPNEYDRQAYIFDPRSGMAECISRDFNPSISSAHWSRAENAIYFSTVDRSFRNIYRYDLRTGKYEKVDTGVDMTGSIDFAYTSPFAVYTGESANEPPRLYMVDLKRNRRSLLFDPNQKIYRYLKTGEIAEWNFLNKRGTEIEGRIHLPPDFDPGQKYPLIVFYYGGTTPVGRSFDGRYPLNLWAANGYVVYVPQPSGAIGYGQDFSALHVNDWGKIVAGEIIDGTKKFLDAHDFIDRERIACIGASYGGFMTMLILTQTDIFTAAVSHAGISMIPSYWGEGFWGYSYSAVATAESFPWNRKDIYIDQSPLFKADKVTTPLLLLTGDADTNVPPGESTQFFLALKMLGKEVAYIEVKDQDHHILDRMKREKWGDSIIAWFDKYLKDQPEWWDEMYE